MAEQLNKLLWKKFNLLWEWPLHGRVEEVKQALAAGADPNARSGALNRTCLMMAAGLNHDRVVELLLSTTGIQVNAKDKDDKTALHYACSGGPLVRLDLILSSPGVQLNERDNEGCTPIMTAIRGWQTQAVLRMAAVPQVCLDRDSQGRSLEEIANM